MLLNANQILQENLLLLENSQGKAAQVGYDLSLKAVQKLRGTGEVLCEKTLLGDYKTMNLIRYSGKEGYKMGWYLTIGAYDIVFNEGCDIPSNRTAMIRQRSSLLRNGAFITSSIFDPGFKTENMGTVMIVMVPIFIEQNARVAQIYFHENEPGEVYAGQWQNDKQRQS